MIDNALRLEESVGGKLLGVVIDPYLSWDLHTDYLIKKLNSTIYLLNYKRTNVHLTIERKENVI